MENSPLSPITPAPPERKKGGCGCFGTGCVVVLVLMLFGGGIGLFTGYKIMEYLRGFTSEQGVEIVTTEGTEEEFAAITEKVDAYDKAVKVGQGAAMQLTAREINILIARHFKIFRGRADVSIKEGAIGAKVSLPLNDVWLVGSVPQFRDRYFNGDVKLRLAVEDGKMRFALEEARTGDKVVPSELCRQLSEGWTQHLTANSDFKSDISRLRKLEAQGDALIIEANPAAAEPASSPTSTPEAKVEGS